ncbi:MAG: 30S ribosomal protein S1 [Hyphomicrobiales bacterium]
MVRRHEEELDTKEDMTEDAEAEAKPRKRRSTTRLVHQDDEVGTAVGVADPDAEEEASAMGQWLQLYEESLKDLEEGEIVRGRVLKIDDKEVTVDVGFKSEGVIPVEEFPDLEGVKVGDEIEVFLEKTENQDGLVVLSKQRADFVKVWDRVKSAADQGELVEGRLMRKIKGGVVVDLYGVEAFLPGSQIALRQVQNVDSLLGQSMEFKIIKLNKRRRNIVVSRRAVLEEHRAKQKSEIIQELAKDQIREGVVKNITDFGAFVDLGGIDGLLHITDMSWGRVSHPSELVSIGDKLRVKVLSFDPEKERISLGLKQLTPYPWEDVDKRYEVGQRVKGRVVSITDYGAFVELEKGIEGLIHISEMSWTRHVRHPSKIVAIGDEIEAMILKIDKENEKISLGLKQIEPDPWLTLDDRFPIGTKLAGKVRNLTNFGAFVEIEEGIDGLVHISDMSWTRRIAHPSEILKKGDKVEVIVLSIDKEARRISLGLKQVSEDPWPTLAERYLPDILVKGKVVRLLDRGVIVDLEDGLEGFIPLSQLGIESLKKPADSFKAGDDLDLKVTRVDTQAHRIILSAKAWILDQDRATQDAFQERFKPNPAPEEVAEPAAEGADDATSA